MLFLYLHSSPPYYHAARPLDWKQRLWLGFVSKFLTVLQHRLESALSCCPTPFLCTTGLHSFQFCWRYLQALVCELGSIPHLLHSFKLLRDAVTALSELLLTDNYLAVIASLAGSQWCSVVVTIFCPFRQMLQQSIIQRQDL